MRRTPAVAAAAGVAALAITAGAAAPLGGSPNDLADIEALPDPDVIHNPGSGRPPSPSHRLHHKDRPCT
jgi:hypothetical protein